MQLCQLESLKDWLNSNTLNRDKYQLLNMFHQIVSAIGYVHQCGLMHRDLKVISFIHVDKHPIYKHCGVKGKGKGRYSSSWEPHLRAMGRHLPYGITVLPATRHKWLNAPRLTPAMQGGTRFTYPRGMEGWVDLVDLIAPRPGVKPATFRSRVRCRTAALLRHVILICNWSLSWWRCIYNWILAIVVAFACI